MVVVGYSLSSKGYRLYNPKDGKVVVGRDVVFDESKLGLPALANRHGEKNSETFTTDLPSIKDKPITLRRSQRNIFPVIRCGIDDYVNHVACLVNDAVEPL